MSLFCMFAHHQDLGLLLLRLGIGASMMIHGWPKLISGPAGWVWYGNQMSLLGITFAPIFWGFCCVMAEFFGGACLAVGFLMPYVPLILAMNMTVALVYHLNNGDGFVEYSQALELLVVFFGLWVAGPGSYALDALICR